MHLSILSYVGDEEDIIEPFVRHHAAIARDMHIVSTGNEEETTGMLERIRCENDNFRLHLFRHRPSYHDQAELLTTMLHELMADPPDWVLPLDADEFVQCRDTAATLASLPEDRIILLPWTTYVPTPEDDERESDPTLRIVHRRMEERPQFHKILIPGSLLRERPVIGAGNHMLLRNGTGEPYPTLVASDIRLAHFPVRSMRQIRRKAEEGWRRTAAKPGRGERESFHWKDILDGLRKGEIGDNDLSAIARGYAGSSPDTAVTFDPLRTPIGDSAAMP